MEGTDGQSAETAASNDAAHELELFLQQDQAELAAQYRRIYARTSEDPGTAGDEGEGNWAQVLQKWLPKRYHVVTKGRVVFPDRSASAQIDVLVLRGSYPPRLLTKKLYLSTGVVAAFECKNTLTAAHVRAAVETAASLKDKVARRAGSLQQELRSPLVYGLLAHSHSWKGERVHSYRQRRRGSPGVGCSNQPSIAAHRHHLRGRPGCLDTWPLRRVPMVLPAGSTHPPREGGSPTRRMGTEPVHAVRGRRLR